MSRTRRPELMKGTRPNSLLATSLLLAILPGRMRIEPATESATTCKGSLQVQSLIEAERDAPGCRHTSPVAIPGAFNECGTGTTNDLEILVPSRSGRKRRAQPRVSCRVEGTEPKAERDASIPLQVCGIRSMKCSRTTGTHTTSVLGKTLIRRAQPEETPSVQSRSFDRSRTRRPHHRSTWLRRSDILKSRHCERSGDHNPSCQHPESATTQVLYHDGSEPKVTERDALSVRRPGMALIGEHCNARCGSSG